MIIDFHSHLGKEDQKDIDIKKIQKHMRNNKISKVVLFPLSKNNLIKTSLKILELSKVHPFVIPFIRFNPNKIQKKELRELLIKGFKGVKLHPRSENFNPLDEKFSWIFREIESFNLPIIFHCKSYHFDPLSHPEKLLKLAKRHPNLKVVMGHFAGVNKKLFKEFTKYPNIWVETSIDVTPNAYREVILEYGFDKLLFGTDFPFSFAEIELEKLRLADLPKHIREKILWKNAAELLKLKL